MLYAGYRAFHARLGRGGGSRGRALAGLEGKWEVLSGAWEELMGDVGGTPGTMGGDGGGGGGALGTWALAGVSEDLGGVGGVPG